MIPKADDNEVVYVQKGALGEIQKNINDRFEKIDHLLLAVVGSVVISGVGVLVSAVGIFIDQAHFNNVLYQEIASQATSTQQSNMGMKVWGSDREVLQIR